MNEVLIGNIYKKDKDGQLKEYFLEANEYNTMCSNGLSVRENLDKLINKANMIDVNEYEDASKLLMFELDIKFNKSFVNMDNLFIDIINDLDDIEIIEEANA